jgi:putative transposase
LHPNSIDKIYTKCPYYGTRRIVQVLKRLGFNVGRKLVKSAMEFMGIRILSTTNLLNKS